MFTKPSSLIFGTGSSLVCLATSGLGCRNASTSRSLTFGGGVLPRRARDRAPGRSSAPGSATAVVEPARATDIDDDCTPAEPILIHLDVEPVTESYVEIVDVKSGHRVVTAIEVLSPTNKRPTEGQRLYLKKRDDLKLAGLTPSRLTSCEEVIGC